jgi:DNA mismatch repair protein MutS
VKVSSLGCGHVLRQIALVSVRNRAASGAAHYGGSEIPLVRLLRQRPIRSTYYQELTQRDKHLPRLRNFSVAVKEWNDEIVFVRRVIPSAADRSYGIQVARLAGLPLSVIDRAKTILAKLESDDTTVSLPAPQAKPKKKITITPADDSQLSLL